ncbi:MAG TPA: PfkB family carbohydrate kinase [Armatimonadota bacterium]|nr:PfkB family carbohydrate kinase [Armatimonadota bacterium]
MDKRILIFGPAYLDVVVEISGPLAAVPLDQSLPAAARAPRADGRITLDGPTGDHLVFPLPPDAASEAAHFTLAEPVLSRVGREDPAVGEHAVARVRVQPGGMGAGYALALGAALSAPFGEDAVGARVRAALGEMGVHVVPALLPDCPSDTSLVILSARGDKLAVGVRRALVRWMPTAEDHELAKAADALVFCGAPNVFMAAVLARQPRAAVLCAPALRNVRDATVPLASLAPRIHYLTLNALEWAHLDGGDAMRAHVPVITVTDGARGSRLLLGAREYAIPAHPVEGPVNANRAGETYGATVFSTLLAACPDFPAGVTPGLAERAARRGADQAARQLRLAGFEFPE